MSEGWFGLLGVIVGASITQGAAWWTRRKRHFAYWSAMSAEVDLCKGNAEAFLRDKIAAPLYRLPDSAYRSGFPVLLGDGVVDHESAQAVLRFYNIVEQMNRGLELAQEARAPQRCWCARRGIPTAARESQHLTDAVPTSDPGGHYYRRVREVIDTGMRHGRLLPLSPYQ